ncbi:replication protein [Rhodococcus sp. PSBB049]|uniref:replication protein n=1 Tax=Rhodococcus sp. PSBB049 TaxID=2812863 RepID=UPI00197D4A1C|nr:replication protein [Rhodococcus sp. PSBB049]QSE72460.1 replication protein [Rhodococcus sp. PSBB049]
MPGTSQGNAHPEPDTTNQPTIQAGAPTHPPHTPTTPPGDPEWDTLVAQATAAVDALHTLNTTTGQRGRSFSLPVPDGRHARIPIWSGRTTWLRQLRQALTTDTGREALHKHHISIDRLMAVATAHAHYADSATGRGVTASRTTLAARAGVSVSTVNRARRVLRTLGAAHELVRGRILTHTEFMAAELHHGGPQHRAASVWALSSPAALVATTPRTPPRPRRSSRAHTRTLRYRARHAHPHNTTAIGTASTRPQVRGRDTLSTGSSVQEPHLSSGSTHQRARARTHTPTRSQPRPIGLQRAAATLVSAAPALAPHHHIGTICDVLTRAGIDTTRWSGRDIAHHLTRDTIARNWTWPTTADLYSPTGYLTWRLRHIDWTRPSPTEDAHTARQQRLRERAERAAARHRQHQTIAGAEHRAAMLDQCRRALRTAWPPRPAPPTRQTEPTGTHSAGIPTSDKPHVESGMD